ncbi:helix-turn-helix domain-containing protein [Nonlabens marinus]|uniref:HTH cro/C1-type domain-containing protein n=1 Tax=Nonlabens marinus S1-08 TaxID=1454201 RepID=W8VNC4_9FLAO|nr:helix-turn-helix domain-containing protein [Nonlabens marinus]BAO54364.1 hypothetical protein NMS_0355 [Nonlabens marinus S1-08]
MESIASKIKQARIRKGMSQEELADQSQISLRTVQRIENEQNEPRGKTLQLICDTLQINIEDLLDYGKKEDRQFLMFFHLSVICGVFIPAGNIILPMILWLTKRDKIIGLNRVGARLLNFQIVWTILSYSLPIVIMFFGSDLEPYFQFVDNIPTFNSIIYSFGGFSFINYALAVVFAILNYRDKQITYPSIIPMIK